MLRAEVTDRVYQGDTFLLQARLADGSAIAARGIAGARVLDALPAPGQPVRLAVALDDTVLLPDEPA